MRRALSLAAVALCGCHAARPAGAPLSAYLDLPRATAPSLSRDGRRLAFLSEALGHPRPFVIDTLPALPPPASRPPASPLHFTLIDGVPGRAQSVRLLGDGGKALVGHDEGGDENTQLSLVDLASGKAEPFASAPGVRHLFGAVDPQQRWASYSSNARNGRDFDVFVRDLAGGKPLRVLEGQGHLEPRAVAPGGGSLLLLERRSGADEDLHLLPLGANQPLTVNITAHRGEARFVDACYSGRALFFLSDEAGDFLELRVFAAPGGFPSRALLGGPFDIDALACSDDGGSIAVATNRNGLHTVRLFHVDPLALALVSGPGPSVLSALQPRAEGHSLPPGVVRAMAFSGDGSELAVQLGRSTEPDQIWTIHTDTGNTTRRTEAGPEIGRLPPMVEPSLEAVRSFDGLEVPFFLYRPRQAEGRRSPAVVWVHGGPEAQFQPSFMPMIQALVARGYTVAAPNVRGSTGHGKRYSHLDDVEKREDSVRDLAALNRWLAERPDVDPKKIAVMGGSYGGYMALASLYLFPDRWAAGVDVSGITSFRTFLQGTAPYRRAQRESEYGKLDSNGALLDLLSPLNHAHQIVAPLLLIHGANDPRVPVTEAEQIFGELRRLGRPVRYLRYEGEGHGLARRENQLDAYEKAITFLDETLSKP